MPSNFWMGVAQSAIGSGLGFVFGICAFHYQQKRQSAIKEKDDWRVELRVLNLLTTVAGANIEAVVNAKLQFVDDLRPEVDKMKAASERFYNAPASERESKIEEIVTLSGSMRHFYQRFPRNSIMSPPEFSEYSLLNKEMPALPMFVHRAMGMMQEINERIESRNALTAGFAQESGAGEGMSSQRALYYSSMLSGEGEAICEHTEFALNFWRLVLDQIKAYKKAKGSGEHLLEFKLIPKALEAMPKKELFPVMREQIKTTFD